ncbi:MAG TPA: LarC family nickel insertion protein, partial [Verrucomicrobiae bacterium]
MKTLYLDIFSGIAGDMFIAALLDLGVDASKLERELKKLQLGGYHLHIARGQKSAIAGVKFDVHLAHDHAPDHGHPHHHADEPHHDHGPEEQRNFSEIIHLISRSKLSAWVKQKAIAVFARIAEAEGKIHGLPPNEVHFHEVGAVDSIVDIVGAAIALELLGKPRVFASPVVEGTGWIKCAHGRFPVPAPA